jgi:hypothetical protein
MGSTRRQVLRLYYAFLSGFLDAQADAIQITIADFLQQQTAALLRTFNPAGRKSVFPPISATL